MREDIRDIWIVDINQDSDFIKLKDFLFSFDFSCKDIIEKQIKNALVVKQKTEYFIAFRFYVDTLYDCLPASFSGLPVVVEVVNGNDHTMCELFASHGYIVEYRLYNINGTALNMDSFWKGIPYYEKTN